MVIVILCLLSDLLSTKGNLAILFKLEILCLCHLGICHLDLVKVICSTSWGEITSMPFTPFGLRKDHLIPMGIEAGVSECLPLGFQRGVTG